MTAGMCKQTGNSYCDRIARRIASFIPSASTGCRKSRNSLLHENSRIDRKCVWLCPVSIGCGTSTMTRSIQIYFPDARFLYMQMTLFQSTAYSGKEDLQIMQRDPTLHSKRPVIGHTHVIVNRRRSLESFVFQSHRCQRRKVCVAVTLHTYSPARHPRPS